MTYVEDTNAGTTYPCFLEEGGFMPASIKVNMSSRQGFLNLKQGAQRSGRFINGSQAFPIYLPGNVTGSRQELVFSRP